MFSSRNRRYCEARFVGEPWRSWVSVSGIDPHDRYPLLVTKLELSSRTAAETSRVQLLCRLIQKETEPRKFSKLVRELDQLLSKKEDRLNQEQPLSPQAHH